MSDIEAAAAPGRISWFHTLFRFWRLKTRHAAPAGNPAGVVGVLTVSWLTLWAVIDWFERQPDPMPAVEGVPVLAWYALGVLALAALLRIRVSPVPSLGSLMVLVLGLVPLPLLWVTLTAGAVGGVWYVGFCGVAVVYALLYFYQGLRVLTGRRQPVATLLGVLFLLAFMALSESSNAIPDIWNPREADPGVSDQQLADRETALFEQSDRIDESLESVQRDASPQAEGFFLGFAGVGDEKVFAQEIGLASRVIGERYLTTLHQVSLVNDERDLEGAPLASVSGLRYALHGIAAHMRLDRDVLFLAISSHGSRDPSIAVSNSQLPFTDLTPEDLADALRESGIQWRVIVISACYAGGFIESLKDAHTVVLTAAAADRTSFGCSSDSDLTYFGEAFYRDALPEAPSLREAFERAKVAISAREKEEGDEPSNPQAFFGAEMEAHLKTLEHDQ